jgi:hypothetical protein
LEEGLARLETEEVARQEEGLAWLETEEVAWQEEVVVRRSGKGRPGENAPAGGARTGPVGEMR